MDCLDDVKKALEKIKNDFFAKSAEKEGYLNMATEIGVVYKRMVEDKELIKGYRKSVKDFSKEKFDTFKGNLYSQVYKAEIEVLISEYDALIKNIDTNMDRLNTVKTRYENEAYKCDGPIGYLQASINSLTSTIENWLN